MTTQSFSVYQNKWFARFSRRARLTDHDLWKAAQHANEGLVDADLGGGVIKQRIARRGEGKSGGYRTIIFFRRGDKAIFVYGFEKKDRANITLDELQALRDYAALVLGYDDAMLKDEIRAGTLIEVRPRKE